MCRNQSIKLKSQDNCWCYLTWCHKEEDFFAIYFPFFLENLRNQGENLEKFKKRPCKAKKREQ